MESKTAKKRRLARILELLHQTYPGATCELDHEDPYQLLVATILSAQCTDKRVNMVTPALFERYPDAPALARAEPAELEKMIQSTGFFRNKTKSLLGMAKGVVERHEGRIPDDMPSLKELPGVGRKTANVVLGTAFHKEEGVVVDTHVHRLSHLLGLTTQNDAEKIERDLMEIVPRSEWTNFSHLVIHHGRAICIARRPRCEECPLYDYCPGHRPLHGEAPVRSTAAKRSKSPAAKGAAKAAAKGAAKGAARGEESLAAKGAKSQEAAPAKSQEKPRARGRKS